ncbi:MAG TPA: hypothetical protein VGQ96_03735, partial [Candidatus Eremiobacteraceae bacterium]|nr:hypothetical protein [Candidatus Eremiobacteraceae bacterium]
AASRWEAFQCQTLSEHMLWTAAALAGIAAALHAQRATVNALALERMHWARCRRGLERRALRESARWPD